MGKENFDSNDITEEAARERAQLAAKDTEDNCRFGISQTRACGYGVLCSMGITLQG